MKSIKLLTLLFGMLGLTQCKAVKFDKQPPFTIHSATYAHIVGGTPGNSTLNLILTYTTKEDVTFENVYFLNRKTKAVTEVKGNKKIIAARYNTSTTQNKSDLVLHSNTVEEFNNKLPKETEKFPFQLKEDEAVISYKKNNTLYFFKVENIKKRKSVFMQ